MIEHEHHLPINLANPSEMMVLDFAEKILKLTGSQSSIEFHPLPEDDPRVREPDISKARELLKWEPRVSLEEGLLETIRYFQERLRGNLKLERQRV